MKLLVSCFGTKTKLCKTIYILKDYIDPIQIELTNLPTCIFQNGCRNHHKK